MADPFILPVKNVVVEWRFDPSLAIYSKMDQLGMELADQYPDWQRSPLTLEIRNKERQRRFFMSHRRCFFDVIGPSDNNVSAELDKAHKLFERLAHETKVSVVRRLGLRQWVAVHKDQSFQDLVRRAVQKFHPHDTEISALLRGEIKDIGYVVDMTTPAGWKYNLRAGPMEKGQWFGIVPHEEQLFKDGEQFAAYKQSFPAQFFYTDIDCYSEDVPRSDVRQLIDTMSRTAHDIARDLNRYFDKG